ncbi:MAG: hypothetical protein RUMPE_00867 [Eubacteriales bacterium SKADARSKE-1]|nr:hypothetical protein [Eubacteriales bacterium SKADARSKE-1]
MKDGYIVKEITQKSVSADELKLINNYTRRDLKSDEVYAFSVILCDNDIDREYEKFTKESLEKLSELFVGKTGILDHDMKSENQKARIFSCKVENVLGKLTLDNQAYYRLKARAYMPISESNDEFILEIDSGIKKEVSVGCAVGKITCSVCGTDLRNSHCEHVKGKKYNNKICCTVLEEPIDAYEWSFVAVPAQKEAGVIKTFSKPKKGGVLNLDEVMKKIRSGEELTITKAQSNKIAQFICGLENLAEVGKTYKEDLRQEVLRLCAMAEPKLALSTMNSVTEKMSLDELKSFKGAFAAKANELLPLKPQLTPINNKKKREKNTEFKM